jgi:RNA polymerase sigma-70 factor (ECF subfamily)
MAEQPSYLDAYENNVFEIYGFFAYRTGSRADAEDLTQATFERAYAAWSRYDPARASTRTWLAAIAHNLLIDHHRRAPATSETPLETDPGLEAPEDRPDLGLDPALARALDLLADREREILALRFGADLSGPEIAKVTELSVANVQQILSRTLRSLRAALEKESAEGGPA